MSPLPYSADSQTAATCHYRQPFRLYASDIYCDANITFLSQTRNKTDAFFGVFHSFVNPPPTGGTHGATMACRGRRERPTPKPTVVGMTPKANENAGIVKACRQGLQNGPFRLAKRPMQHCQTAHIARRNGPFCNGRAASHATRCRPATQPAAGQAVCRSRPVGAKTARHPGCGSKAPKAETTHSRPQYKTKGAAPHDATPSKNPNLFISYRNITVIACFKMRWAASRIATRRQLRQHNAPHGMRPAMDAAAHAKINITLQLLRV